MTCGIYLGSPKNISIDKVYIGQSTNIEKRINRHNRDMRNGVHSKKMQEAFNTYGEFEWEILLESNTNLDNLETQYIKLFNACTDGFNTYEDTSDAPIVYGTANAKVRDLDKDLTKLILNTTLSFPTYSKEKIAQLTNCKMHVVSYIWYGDNRQWLLDMFPIEYQKVRDLLGNRQIGGRSAKQQGLVFPLLLSPDFEEYSVDNIRQFAEKHQLDKGDLNNVLNLKVASVKGWIVKDLDIINPEMHLKFYSTNRGHYKKQFNAYKDK